MCVIFACNPPSGHIVRNDGIVTQHPKISVIQNWSELTEIKCVRVFVSLCTYITSLFDVSKLHNLSQICCGLTVGKLLFLRMSWMMSTNLMWHFAPVLQFYDVNTPTDLYVDDSGQSIGDVLKQIKDGCSHPIGYYNDG